MAVPALAAGLLPPAALPGAPVPAQLEPRAEGPAVPIVPPLVILRVERDGVSEYRHFENLPTRAGPVPRRHITAWENELHERLAERVSASDGLDGRRLGRSRRRGIRGAEGAADEEEEVVVDSREGEDQLYTRRDGEVRVHAGAAVAGSGGGERDGHVRVVNARDSVHVVVELQDGLAAAFAGGGKTRVAALVRLAVVVRDRLGVVVGKVERVADVQVTTDVRAPPAGGDSSVAGVVAGGATTKGSVSQ